MAFSLGSQGLNSASNLGIAILVAHTTDPTGYGAWAVVYTLIVLALQGMRALVSTPVLIHRAVDETVPRWLQVQAISAVLLIGLAVGLMMLPVGFFLPEGSWRLVVGVALCLPLLMVQDALRFIAFRSSDGRRALAIDAAWIGLQIPLLGIAWAADSLTPLTTTIAWAGAAALNGAFWTARSRLPIRVALGRTFLRDEGPDGRKLLAEAVLGTGVLQLLPVLLAATSTFAVAGGIRASQTLFGPITFLIMGVTPLMTAAAVARHRRGENSTRLLWMAALAVGAGAFAGLLLVQLFPVIGRALTGNSWTSVSSILLPAAIASALRGLTFGVPVILRAKHELDEALRLRVHTSVPALLLPVAGAIWDGLAGAAWGIAASYAINNVQSLVAYHRSRQGDSGTSDAS